jgi:hypothetical protein
MRALALAALAASTTGCFTGWVTTQAVGGAKFLDEGVREQAVPQDGVEERLAVSIPLAYEYDEAPAGTSPSPRERTPRPFALTCSTRQYAQDRVYHSAFRYGSKWKKTTAISFLVEAALGAAFLLIDRNRDLSDPEQANDRTGLLVGGFFALDAIGTAAIFFIPRKEVFTVEDKAVMTPIRDDCPEGLVLEIGGTSFPIDALGGIGELGEVALDEWMRATDDSAPGASSAGALALTFEGRAMPLRVDARERCAWVRAREGTNASSASASGASASGASGSGVSGSGTSGSGASASGASASGAADEGVCNTQGRYVTTTDLPRVTTAVITVPTGSLSMALEPSVTTR